MVLNQIKGKKFLELYQIYETKINMRNQLELGIQDFQHIGYNSSSNEIVLLHLCLYCVIYSIDQWNQISYSRAISDPTLYPRNVDHYKKFQIFIENGTILLFLFPDQIFIY